MADDAVGSARGSWERTNRFRRKILPRGTPGRNMPVVDGQRKITGTHSSQRDIHSYAVACLNMVDTLKYVE